MKTKVSIKSTHGQEFATKVEADGKIYIVQTDDQGSKSCKIITRVYLDGAVVNSFLTDYSDIAGAPDVSERLKAMIAYQHEEAVQSLKKETVLAKRPIIDYAKEMNGHLKLGASKAALMTVEQANADYPTDPFFLSYMGYLTALVDKHYREGCTLCEKALSLMAKTVSEDKELFYPILYVNMGRAYVLAGKKPEAIKAFKDGLRYDPKNRHITAELAQLGFRRPPVLSFLDRSNPINKYLGKIRYRFGR